MLNDCIQTAVARGDQWKQEGGEDDLLDDVDAVGEGLARRCSGGAYLGRLHVRAYAEEFLQPSVLLIAGPEGLRGNAPPEEWFVPSVPCPGRKPTVFVYDPQCSHFCQGILRPGSRLLQNNPWGDGLVNDA